MVNKKLIIVLVASVILTGCVPYGGGSKTDTKLATETKVETPKSELLKEEIKETPKEEVKQEVKEAPKVETPKTEIKPVEAKKQTTVAAAPRTSTQNTTQSVNKGTTPTGTVPNPPPPTNPDPPVQQKPYTVYDALLVDESKVIKQSPKYKVSLSTTTATKFGQEIFYTVEHDKSTPITIGSKQDYGGNNIIGGTFNYYSENSNIYKNKIVVQKWGDATKIDVYIFVREQPTRTLYEYKFTVSTQ
ncbi:hypothetical protein [Clostridium polynesiense]|uniref:hypothetical protein n=1 Tax=Clostridium polynesiense TaxID=1325933 RepID=UPI00058D0217|nr:hypothetical protein [Clostridium polynesiense]